MGYQFPGENSSISDEATMLDECQSKPFTAIPVFLILLSILGIIGNLLVIYLILILREYKKTITNLYLVQLAVSDLLFMVFLPVEAHSIVKGATQKTNALCKMYQGLRFLSYYSSVFFLTVMSLDRYLAINHAMTSWAMKLRNKKAVYLASITVWLLCLSAVLPLVVRSSVQGCKCSTDFLDTRENLTDYSGDYSSWSYDYNDTNNSSVGNENYDYEGSGSMWINNMTENDFDKLLIDQGILPCSFDNTPDVVSSVYWNFFGAFIIPLAIIVVCYINILAKVSKPTISGAKSSNSSRARKRVTKMVVLLVATFIICWLPYHIFQLARIKGIPINTQSCDKIREWFSILAYANSVLNPILYTFLGSNVRAKWKEVLHRTRSLPGSFGSRSNYRPNRGTAKKSRSLTGDYSSQASFTTKSSHPRNLHTTYTKAAQSEDGLA